MKDPLKMLEAQRIERERQQQALAEEMKELKLIARQLFSSENGQRYARFLMKQSGINRIEKSMKLEEMCFERGKEYMYMLIKAMLPADLISEIEGG